MNKLSWLIGKTKGSPLYLWLLNKIAQRIVPFNKPHCFKILSISNNAVTIELPYIKKNLNHIKGIHACALATLCEYCSGLVLLSSTDSSLYRVILQNINITYHYQAKTAVFAKFELSKEWIESTIINPLKNNDAAFAELKIEVYDKANNHICTGIVNWQVKLWKNVRTKQ